MSEIEIAITQRSIEYRGTILHKCISLEKLLDYCITHHFSDEVNKRQELTELLLDRTYFDSKIGIWETIMKKLYSKEVFKKRFSKLFSEMRYCKDQRNIFAHYMVYSYDNAIEDYPKKISFINFRNSMTLEHYPINEYEQLLERIDKCNEVLVDLAEELYPNRAEPK